MCCVWDSLGWVGGSEILLRVGEIDVCLWECVCAVCGTVWCGIGVVSMCCVWARFVSVCGSVYVLSVGQFVVGLE